MVITHSEYFVTLSSAVTEAFAGYLINPCNTNLFPWLSGIAGSWERYRFRSLVFKYKTTCSTTFAGDMGMAIDFDAKDSLPTEFGAFSSHEGAVTGNYYGNLDCHAIIKNFDKQNRGWYLTSESARTAELAQFYGGMFETYTSAATAATPVGKLYVEYTIELNNPQPKDINGLTTMALLDDLTINTALGLVGNYVAQAGATTVVGNEAEVTTSGIKFLKGGNYDVNVQALTVTDAATIANSLTSTNGTVTTIFDVHDTTSDVITRLVRLVGVSPGDFFDFVVGGANMVMTDLQVNLARYMSSSY